MLLAIKIFIMFFFVVPLTGAILFLIVAADAMKRDEETGRAQIRERRKRLEERREKAYADGLLMLPEGRD